MRASNLAKAAALAVSVAWVAGCSTTSNTADSGSASGAAGSGASSQGAGSGSGVSGSSVAGSAQSVANLRTVFYFDFDKSVVQAEGFADLEGHAKYLSANPGVTVRLEGHADERGTREYNMALGERRAKAVARFLQINGVSADQFETISYGEEKPAVLGHDRGSWAQNRRVELKYVR